jgi:ABC-type transport system involved in cytochrome c biogenesis permease subunit
MELLAHHFFYVSMGLYGLAALLLLLSSRGPDNGLLRMILIVAFVAHSISMVIYTAILGYIPLYRRSQDFFPQTWGLALVVMLMLPKLRDNLLTAITLAGILVICLVNGPLKLPTEIETPAFYLTPAPMMWFYLKDASIVAFAFCFSLSLTRLLRRGSDSDVMPNNELEKMVYSAALWGFVLFSAAQVAGSVWAHFGFGGFWLWRPMHFDSALIWIFYAAMLHAPNLSRRTGPIMGIVGFAIIICTGPIMGIVGFAIIMWWKLLF